MQHLRAACHPFLEAKLFLIKWQTNPVLAEPSITITLFAVSLCCFLKPMTKFLLTSLETAWS